MKRSLSFALIVLIAAISLAVFVQTSIAADLMLNTEIKQMTVRNDKNGNEYVRFIIEEDKELNGVAYKTETVVMCFGGTVEQAKAYAEGDKLKAIASSNEYRGRTNYNIVAFVQ